MDILPWLGQHWLDLVESAGIVGGLVFTGITVRKDDRAREIDTLISVEEQYKEIWMALYERPQLSRVLKPDLDLSRRPVNDEEGLFVKLLLLHLDTVHRAMEAGMFVEIQGLHQDIRSFLSLPIPSAVWKQIKPFQQKEFADFIETTMAP